MNCLNYLSGTRPTPNPIAQVVFRFQSDSGGRGRGTDFFKKTFLGQKKITSRLLDDLIRLLDPMLGVIGRGVEVRRLGATGLIAEVC